MKRYNIERLVSKAELEPYGITGKTDFYAPVPLGSDHTFMVVCAGEGYMIVKKGTKPVGVRTFTDKFGRSKKYRLQYWEWHPYVKKNLEVEVPPVMESTYNGFSQDQKEFLRNKLSK